MPGCLAHSKNTQCSEMLGGLQEKSLAFPTPLMFVYLLVAYMKGFSRGSVVKNLPATQELQNGFDPWVGRPPGGGHDDPLQYFRLENPMDRGAWWALVHRVTKSRTQLKQLNTYMIQATVNKDLAKNNTHKDCSSI